MESNRHFTTIVVGENPEEIMKKYDSANKVEPYVVYEFSKIKQYRENYIKCYEGLCKEPYFSEDLKNEYIEKLNHCREISDIDFYAELTDDFDIDPETGNAMCDLNPNGKYNWCRIGKNLAMPLINLNGIETFKERKNNIKWDEIHLAKQDIYIATWEIVMEGRKPITKEEKTIYENMKNRTEYFKRFKNKENYVSSNTAFWGYVFVDESGWYELKDSDDQFEWMNNFYDRFIKDLPENSLISVFECYRN